MSAAWTFEAWFRAQCGKRPSRRILYDLIHDADAAEAKAGSLRALASATQVWEQKRTAARYAWNLEPNQKRKASR